MFNLPSIEFTYNNFFWTIFGAFVGIVLTHFWTAYRERKKLFVSFYCKQDYNDKCFYLFISVHNEGHTTLPSLLVKLKNSPRMGGDDFYFEKVNDVDELK